MQCHAACTVSLLDDLHAELNSNDFNVFIKSNTHTKYKKTFFLLVS